MQVLQREQLVNIVRVIPVALQVPLDDALDASAIDVGTRETARIQKHLTNVLGEAVPIPHAKVSQFVPSQEQILKPERREQVIDSGQPLRHPVIVCVLGLDRKLEKGLSDGSNQSGRC